MKRLRSFMMDTDERKIYTSAHQVLYSYLEETSCSERLNSKHFSAHKKLFSKAFLSLFIFTALFVNVREEGEEK